ncbi:site-specific integrase [Candidatus Parcubacteria bacterium]|nr:site-specific integrase [Candidatus Parcubacteria bacterium]
MSVRKFRNSWFVDITFKNIPRFRKSSPQNTKEGAKAYEAMLRQRLTNGEPLEDCLSDNKIKQEQSFKDFAWDWYKTCIISRNKHSEIKRKKYALRTNLFPFFGKIPLNKITKEHIDRYKAQKQKEGVMPKTINNHLSVLRTCLNVAREWYGLDKLPKVKLFRVSSPSFSYLTEEECELLLSKLSSLWYEIVLTAIKTGLRMGELQGLQWEDINWDTRVLTVRHSWCEVKNGLTNTKSGKERYIPLTGRVYEMLYRRRKEGGFVFVNKRDRKFYSRKLNQKIGEACRKAGLKTITCHKLRHSFASHLVMKNGAIKAIQELMGHANIQTTMIYSHLSPSCLRDTIGLLEDKPQFEILRQHMGNRVFENKKTRRVSEALVAVSPYLEPCNG